MNAEALRRRLDDLRWRYLPYGVVVHALSHRSDCVARCGIWLAPAEDWLGTGTQAEYEKAARLPYCRRCLAAIEVPVEEAQQLRTSAAAAT